MASYTLKMEMNTGVEVREFLSSRFPDRSNPLKFILASDEAIALYLLEYYALTDIIGKAVESIPEEKRHIVFKEFLGLEDHSNSGQ